MTSKLSRRTVLRGVGTALALPLLDCMLPAGSTAVAAESAAAPAAAAPLRLAYLYVPNGVVMDHWRPTKEGADYDLPSILEPLSNVKSEVSVLTGLTHQKAFANGDGGGDHARALSTFLTGVQVRKTHGADIAAGISADQIAASQVGKLTRFPSLEIGCEAGSLAGNCDSGYSCAYSHSIAWRTESTPVAKEVNPKLVFERLFSSGRPGESEEARATRERYNKSVLDFVMDDAKRLHNDLGLSDRRKMDEYLSAVRELEQRIARADAGPAQEAKEFNVPKGIPKEYAEHLRLMGDLMVLAFQTDTTRICTYIFADEGSNRPYRMLGISSGHHELSHHGRDKEKLESLRKINHFHMEAYAYVINKLRSIKEGEGTLLDNCMIVYGSGISDGDRHNHDDLPVLLAGRGGGTITPGRHVKYSNGTPMANLHLSLLDRLGCKVEKLGDSSGRAGNLKA
jgi:hypothetical protein